MTKFVVAKNKIVSLSYVLRNQQGEIFEYSDLPVTTLHGSGNDLFPKIEQALEGQVVGDRVVAQLSPPDSFGATTPTSPSPTSSTTPRPNCDASRPSSKRRTPRAKSSNSW
jgi:FKBP-type peptidyl-prolyl cis-trans isomerase 2